MRSSSITMALKEMTQYPRKNIAFLYKGRTKEDSVSGAAGTGSGLKRSINAQGKRFVSSPVLTSSYTHCSASVVDDSSSESENDSFEYAIFCS